MILRPTSKAVSYSKADTAFGKSPRLNDNRNESPGPGAYDYLTNGGKGGKAYMSKKGRDGLRASEIPGPGAYDDREAFDRMSSAKGGIKFGKSTNQARQADVPGPGAYNQDGVATTSRARGIKFGKDARDKFGGDDKPGPGAYDMKDGNVAGNIAKFSFPKDPRSKPQKSDTPFYYDVPHTIPDVAKYNYPDMANRKIHL